MVITKTKKIYTQTYLPNNPKFLYNCSSHAKRTHSVRGISGELSPTWLKEGKRSWLIWWFGIPIGVRPFGETQEQNHMGLWAHCGQYHTSVENPWVNSI